MTATLRDKADLFDRIQRQFRRAERHRRRIAFLTALDEIARRGPPAPSPHSPPHESARRVDDEGRVRFEQAMRDLLVRVHGRTSSRPTPGDPTAWWSNERVSGYRMWSVTGGALWGAKTQWSSATKTAQCLKGHAVAGSVPHLSDHCGAPPCGIYALKDPERLWRRARRQLVRTPTAVGLVEMEGRVIEHTGGYRAERAVITRLAVIAALPTGEARLGLFDERADIECMCRVPRTAPTPLEASTLREAIDMARAWL